MPNDYCTAAEVKAAMPDGNWGLNYDALLALTVTRASRAIDLYAMRRPGAFYVSGDTTEYFDGNNTTHLRIGELAAAPTSVAVAETGIVDSSGGTGGSYTTWAATDYLLWPYNAVALGIPYQRLDVDTLNGSKASWYAYAKAVKVVGKHGYSIAIPDPIKEAAIIQAARWFKRGQQAFQDTGAVIELGQLRYTQRLDPDVAQLLSFYRRVTT